MNDMKTIDAIACEFAITLKSWATPDEWQTMRETNARNARDGITGICASHDFCDANEAMAQAFATIVGREAKVLDDGDNALWSVAWDCAQLQFLTA